MENLRLSPHIRTAIGLGLLSYKPPEQSISSYILDLQSRFPVSGNPTKEVQDDPWRTRALALEEENENLKISVQKYELEIQALKVAPIGAREADLSAQTSKKKRKAPQPSKSCQDKVDLRALVKDIRSGPRLPALQGSLDILTSFRAVFSSNGAEPSESDQEKILIPNIKRSLSALGKLLSAVLARDGSIVATSSRVDVAKCLCDLLLTLLNSTLPLAPLEAIVPHIMGDLALNIVTPIIQAFHPLSVREITYGIKEGARKKNDIDIRPNLISILQRLIGCLRSLKARTRDLRELMIHQSSKEIEIHWSTTTTTTTSTRECITTEQRIEKLARKDSLWYQCSVLHAALDGFPTSKTLQDNDESLVRSEAVRVLADLMRHFDRGCPVDEVGKNMVLGVIEKAWLGGLHENEES